MTNWCSNCEELILNTSIMRHDTHSRPIEQSINPKFCPICGNKLVTFPGWDSEEIQRGKVISSLWG